MDPEVCVATVGALPSTGSDAAWWPLALVAAVAVAGGILLLGAARGRRAAGARPGGGVRAGAGVVGIVGLVLVAGAAGAATVAGPTTPASAAAHPQAAADPVDYGDGCTLIEVGEVAVPVIAQQLVPGVRVLAVSAAVTNPTGEPIEIALAGTAGPALEGLVIVDTTIDGVTADETGLAPGARAQLALYLELPDDTGNEAQGIEGRAALTITAVQR